MGDDAQNPAETPPPSMWEKGWKGFKEKAVGYIPYIPKALLMTSLFLGGLLLLKPHMSEGLNNFFGTASLSDPVMFAGRLALTLAVGVLFAGLGGAYEAMTATGAQATPQATGQAAEQGNEQGKTQQKQLKIDSGLPPGLNRIQPAAGKSSASRPAARTAGP